MLILKIGSWRQSMSVNPCLIILFLAVILITSGPALAATAVPDLASTAPNTSVVINVQANDTGTPDVVFTNGLLANQLYLQNNSGSFTSTDISPAFIGSYGVALGDLNEDGFIDIVIGRQGNEDYRCLNDGDGTFTCGEISPLGSHLHPCGLGRPERRGPFGYCHCDP
jgi:hypothetical protein